MSGSRVKTRGMHSIPGTVLLLVLAGSLFFGAAAQDGDEHMIETLERHGGTCTSC